jgi:hypothetical protein
VVSKNRGHKRIRTAVAGFADRCLTAWLCDQLRTAKVYQIFDNSKTPHQEQPGTDENLAEIEYSAKPDQVNPNRFKFVLQI